MWRFTGRKAFGVRQRATRCSIVADTPSVSGSVLSMVYFADTLNEGEKLPLGEPCSMFPIRLIVNQCNDYYSKLCTKKVYAAVFEAPC